MRGQFEVVALFTVPPEQASLIARQVWPTIPAKLEDLEEAPPLQKWWPLSSFLLRFFALQKWLAPFFDYWNAGGICLVEWADRVLSLLPQDAWLIRIEPVDTTRRRLSLEVPAQAASAIEQLLVASC